MSWQMYPSVSNEDSLRISELLVFVTLFISMLITSGHFLNNEVKIDYKEQTLVGNSAQAIEATHWAAIEGREDSVPSASNTLFFT